MRYGTFGFVAMLLASSEAMAGPDLTIGDDEIYRRPNSWSQNQQPSPNYALAASRPGVSIAWRNANQIEEVEVRVVNLGNESGSGRLSVDVVDAEGRVLLHLTPPAGEEVVQVPAANLGGRQGKIIRMQASWELNGLIDRFDLAHVQYGIMATIQPLGQDDDLSNNRKTKTWNNMSRVVPGGTTTFNYALANHESERQTFQLRLERSHVPPDWRLSDSNEGRGNITLGPGESVRGTLSLTVPSNLAQIGAFSEVRISLVEPTTGSVYRQNEWFEIFDTVPPVISNYRAVLLRDHTVAIQALVSDQHSGVLEATGVSTEYSVDGGRTWARKAHNYKTGNFIRPTLFETVLGPFPAGTDVMLRFTARDTAGNTSSIIPSDATAFAAPPGAEQLIQMAYVFPRLRPNPVFQVEQLRVLSASIRSARARGLDLRRMRRQDFAAIGLSENRLAELGMDDTRLSDLASDLERLGLTSLDFGQIAPVAVTRVTAAGESVMPVNTIQLTIQ